MLEMVAGTLVIDEEMPERGAGRIIQILPGKRLEIRFGPHIVRDDGTRNRIRRLILPPGAWISPEAPREGTAGRLQVVKVALPSRSNGLVLYSVNSDGSLLTLEENEIRPAQPLSDAPIHLLEALQWRGAFRFAVRREVHRTLITWQEQSNGLTALLGARIRPMAHQIYAFRRILGDRVPRFVLADEVGLGKTIEVGLVLQSLFMAKPDLRVLVIAPGSMTRQWWCELYLRFGGRAYRHIESDPSRKLRRADLASRRLIVSTAALTPGVQLELLQHTFDMVVVDEAHQFPPEHPLYQFFSRLSLRTEGYLVVSATPSRAQAQGLLGLLALVAPDVYDIRDPAPFARRLRSQEQIWDLLSYTQRIAAQLGIEKLAPMDAKQLADEWQGVIEDDPKVEELRARIEQCDSSAVNELVGYVQEYYRLDHRIIRTRRSTIAKLLGYRFCRRQGECIVYEPDLPESLIAEQLNRLSLPPDAPKNLVMLAALWQRAASSSPAAFLSLVQARLKAAGTSAETPEVDSVSELFLSDTSPLEAAHMRDHLITSMPLLPGERDLLRLVRGPAVKWAAESAKRPCARFSAAIHWIEQHLRASERHKVLVFVDDALIVCDFARWASANLPGVEVETFHRDRRPSDLNDAAQRFQQSPKVRVLVSDELGGEGRNFHMASAVLHVDQPWAVARVEQRIGRLDRVGRDPDWPVLSVSIIGPTKSETSLAYLHRDVFQVHSNSIGGLEFILPALHRKVAAAIGHGGPFLDSLLTELPDVVGQELQRVDLAFDTALDATRSGLEQAQQMVEVLERINGARYQEEILRWASLCGIGQKRSPARNIELRWQEAALLRPLLTASKGSPSSEDEHQRSYVGTFERADALEHEEWHFFGPGHEVIDALAADVRQCADGRTAVVELALGPAYAGHVVVLIVTRCQLDLALCAEPLSPGLVYRARQLLWEDLTHEILHLGALRNLDQHPRLVEAPDPLLAVIESAFGPPFDHHTFAGRLPVEALAQGVRLPELWQKIHSAAAMTVAGVRARRGPDINQLADALAQEFAPDLAFLNGQLAVSSGASAAKWKDEIRQRIELIGALRNEAITVDSIALIIGKET